MIKRTHDEFYATEDWKDNTKESFKYIGEKVLEKFGEKNRDEQIDILDIGCSNGDFLFYLSNLFPNARLSGADILPTLLEKMKSDFEKYHRTIPQSYLCDIQSGEGLPRQKFDMVFMNGVIGIFDDLRNPLKNFLSLLNDDGIGYIWAGFNPYPIDVLIKGRVIQEQDNGGGGIDSHWESGWNMWSQATLLKELEILGYQGKFYDDFSIGIDIESQEDILRSWTLKMENQKRIIINGLGLIHYFSLLEVSKIK